MGPSETAMTTGMTPALGRGFEERCWCGNTEFKASPHPTYSICLSCGTAKLKSGLETGQQPVADEHTHLYGEAYWNEHMRGFGYPPIAARARADLAERAQYWLTHLLKYCLPPGRALELGCAHGGFVKLLELAGFDATGIEMSPSIIQQAQAWFGVRVLQGPIEHVSSPLGKFHVICMFDVIEHLASPLSTMRSVIDCLDADGVLMVQTPCHEGIAGSAWHNYKPPEHTFLFSRSAIRELFVKLGLDHISFEPALFGGDMFLLASRRVLTSIPRDRIAERLSATPNGRIALAMQDMYEDIRDIPNLNLATRFGTKSLSIWLLRSVFQSARRRLGGGKDPGTRQ
jgi:SAM-dependent methyltransferase